MIHTVGDLKRVGECIASHRLLSPDHEVMAKNRDFFINDGSIDVDWFVPRDETVMYHHRDLYERKLEEFIEQEFTFDQDSNKIDLKSPSSRVGHMC